MNHSTYRFTLDIHQARSQVSIPVFFQDTWVRFLINLTDGGKPYTLEEVGRAVLYGKKSDGTALLEECPIIDNNTRIQYTFSEQTASALGPVNCEIRLYSKSGLHLTSPSFSILVEERVIEDEDIVESETSRTALDELFETEEARKAAEAGRVEAEADRASAEAERVEAEAERQEEEGKRQELAEEMKKRLESLEDGKDGYTPVRGKDYWTEEDKAEIKSYVDEAILGGEW